MEQIREPKTGMAYSSLEAHEEVKPNKESQYDDIIHAMRYIGIPVISKQISNLKSCPLDRYQVARRLPEMESRGIVKVVGRCPNMKNRPLLWELTPSYKMG
ncbi:MAG: hypothetical protein AAF600_13045 [Bacteroidota bacterium]